MQRCGFSARADLGCEYWHMLSWRTLPHIKAYLAITYIREAARTAVQLLHSDVGEAAVSSIVTLYTCSASGREVYTAADTQGSLDKLSPALVRWPS